MSLTGTIVVGVLSLFFVSFIYLVTQEWWAGRKLAKALRSQAPLVAFNTLHNRVTDFLEHMVKSPLPPTDIADVNTLPHPKEELLKALTVMLRLTPDKGMREAFVVGAMTLANYQPGVGPKPLRQVNLPRPELVKSGDLDAMVKVMFEGVDRERWAKFNQQVQVDQLRIQRLVVEASAQPLTRRRGR